MATSWVSEAPVTSDTPSATLGNPSRVTAASSASPTPRRDPVYVTSHCSGPEPPVT